MAEVLVYTKKPCPYCENAKRFLKSKGVNYTEKFLTEPDEMAALKKQTGWSTFPQIFINGKLIGGYTDMMTLEENGELDKLLGA